ncbi:MAG TPA: protein arginine kinase [Opitutaceae bacterium]|nr:protein arginine kinase [Opitutaceae bacterium]
MKFAKSNKPQGRDPDTEARLAALLESGEDAGESILGAGPIVLMTRVRLARNLSRFPFTGWAKEAQRSDILAECTAAVRALPQMKKGIAFTMEELSDHEKQLLVERHLISRELSASKAGSGVVISRDCTCSIMVNEEDHLRMQVIKPGFQLKRVWKTMNAVDSALEESLDYAFDTELGYLTACPTNLGTGLRASAMMHLPALVITGQMDKIVRALNQLGLVVRGLHGEGTDASGSIFQISNQTTLGESEAAIIDRLHNVLTTVFRQEMNAREKLLEAEPVKLFDKIGRAYGLLQNARLVTSAEALNLLSLLRLGVDLGGFPEALRVVTNRLIILSQPAHIQHSTDAEADPAQRDILRAELLRKALADFPRPEFTHSGPPPAAD